MRNPFGALSNIGGEKMPTVDCRTSITFEGRLREEKTNLEKRLADINAVLDSLKNNPEVTKVLEAINKLQY